MIISMIVAMDRKGGIGKNNQIPWHLPSDLKRFKKITLGHCIIMGRKTYESIGKALPGRTMIVVSRRKNYLAGGCIVFDTLDKAIEYARRQEESELFIIGGGEIFSQSMKNIDRIYLTKIDADVNADVFFPPIDERQWKIIHQEEIIKEEKDQYQYGFQILYRGPELGS